MRKLFMRNGHPARPKGARSACRAFGPVAALLASLILASPVQADDWNPGVGALHTGLQFGTADKSGKIVSGYFGGDFALFQKGLDLGVTSFLIIGAAISTKGQVLFTLTPIAFGSDHVQAGIDLIWAPGREPVDSPFGISIRIPFTFY
jgi:hypothetical protein